MSHLKIGDIVTYEHLYNFYRVKFDILTYSINNMYYDLYKTFGDYDYNKIKWTTEQEYYDEVMLQKINDIVTGKNKFLNDYFKEDSTKVARLVSKYVRFGNDILNLDLIGLNYGYSLSLLKAFDSKDGLDRFFFECRMPILMEDKLVYALDDGLITWSNYVPLETLFLYSNRFNSMEELQELYKLFNMHRSDNVFRISGIKEINLDSKKDEEVHHNQHIIEKIRKLSHNKYVICDNDLKVLQGDLFAGASPINISFSEFTTIIDSSCFKNGDTVLPTVEKITNPELGKYRNINFMDYKKSRLLNNLSSIKFFLKDLFTIDVVNKESRMYLFTFRMDSITLDGEEKIMFSDLFTRVAEATRQFTISSYSINSYDGCLRCLIEGIPYSKGHIIELIATELQKEVIKRAYNLTEDDTPSLK